jgi:hypothetical protein
MARIAQEAFLKIVFAVRLNQHAYLFAVHPVDPGFRHYGLQRGQRRNNDRPSSGGGEGTVWTRIGQCPRGLTV